MFFILLVIVCCLSAYIVSRQRTNSKCEPPGLSGGFSIAGHTKLLFGTSTGLWNFLKHLSEECNKVDGVMRVDVGPVKGYVISDPDDATTVLNACNNKHYVYSFARAFLGSGLLTAPVSTWKVHRKILSPIVNQQVLNRFMGVFNKQAKRLVDMFDAEVEKGTFNHEEHILISSLETICQTALGVDMGDKSASNVEYLKAIDQLMSIFVQRFTKLWLHNKYAYNMSNLKKQQDELLKIIHNMTNSILLTRKIKLSAEVNAGIIEDSNGTSDEFSPFIDHILKLCKENESLTDTEVLDEVNTLIITGYDTVADSLCYLLMLIGSYPEVQERIYKEMLDVFGDSNRNVEKNDLSKLVYMEAVIKESLRHITTIPLVGRYNKTEIPLRNYVIPAFSTIMVMVNGIHTNSVWGEDADKFRPERWLNPATLPQNPNAFAVFGIGRRSCIGKNYAMMSIKTTLTHILRRFKVTSDVTKLVLKMEVLLKPASGQHICLELRK